MKLFITFLFFTAVFLNQNLQSGDGNWSENYSKALEQAKLEKKMLLILFTGSDWCSWCMKWEKEAFSKPAFKDYAKKNLILLKLDFPQGKSQSASLKKQNEKLRDQYGITGYPNLIVLNSEGKQIEHITYTEGGPAPLIEVFEKLKSQ